MHTKPKNQSLLLSICIPTYNRSSFLELTLSAVAHQVDELAKYCEIIISDNASSDPTSEVVRKFQKKYSNIRYFRNESNLGGRQNIWKVTTYALGKYIWLLGDDDMPTPGAVQHILTVLQDVNKTQFLKLLILNSGKVDHDFAKSSISWGEMFSFQSLSELTIFPLGLDILNHFPIKELGYISALVFERQTWLDSSYQDYPKFWIYSHLISVVEVAAQGCCAYSPRLSFLGYTSDQSWCLDRGVFSYCYEFPFLYQLAVSKGFCQRSCDGLIVSMWRNIVRQYIKMLIFKDTYHPSIEEMEKYHGKYFYFFLFIYPLHFILQSKLLVKITKYLVNFLKPDLLHPRRSIKFEV